MTALEKMFHARKSTTTRRSFRTVSSKSIFFTFSICLMLMKFVLVGRNEIVSIQDDSAVYAQQSLGAWTLGYPEGYPAWLTLCHLFDVPQRMAIEGLYLVGALLLGYSIKRLLGTGTGLLVFTLLTVSSSTIFLFDRGLADGLFTCLTLFAFGFTLMLFMARNTLAITGWALALGATWGIMAITRNEDPLLALWMVLLVFLCAHFWNEQSGPISLWLFFKRPLLTGLIASATASLTVFALCLSYSFADGVFARGIALLPGHVKLLKSLAQIDTGEPLIRFLPISRKAREEAYSVSPTFKKYRLLIENPNDGWQVLSRQFGLPVGEIGGGWIWHAINTKVIAQWGGRPALAEAEYHKINAEVERAFNDGRLKSRFVIHPLIGGNLISLLKELPTNISAVADSTFNAEQENIGDQGFNAHLFDEAFVRRAALIAHAPEVTIQGWAFVNKPGQKITSVKIGSQLVSNAEVSTQDRPDVITAYSHLNGWSPTVVGFHTELRSPDPDQIKITYFLEDGSRIETDHVRSNQISKLANKIVYGDDVLQGIDLAGVQGRPQGPDFRHEIELGLVSLARNSVIRSLSFTIVFLAVVLTGVGFFLAQTSHWKSYMGLYILTLTLGFARIIFYAVLDARAWPGNQIRYLAPAHSLFLVVLGISTSLLITLLLNRKASPKEMHKFAF